jgi:hypothetical protein
MTKLFEDFKRSGHIMEGEDHADGDDEFLSTALEDTTFTRLWNTLGHFGRVNMLIVLVFTRPWQDGHSTIRSRCCECHLRIHHTAASPLVLLAYTMREVYNGIERKRTTAHFFPI